MQYRCLVGSLHYLVHTRLDLAFAVGYVSWFMERPTMEHEQTIKWIPRYVSSTLDYSLWYERCPGATHLINYCDSDLTDDINTSKSMRDILFFLGNCPVSWQSLKQRVVELSSCEAEYIAATSVTTQTLWLTRLLGRKTETVELMGVSKSALALTKNSIFHERSKHIRIKYHFIRSCLEEVSVKAIHISTENQLTNILTNSLG
jgi:hypothetical protein